MQNNVDFVYLPRLLGQRQKTKYYFEVIEIRIIYDIKKRFKHSK